MSADIVDEPSQQTLLFLHKVPWCWWRLRELHLVAARQRPGRFHVLDPAIRDEYVVRAYLNALGSAMAMQAALDDLRFGALMEQLADFLESVGIDGLEPVLLSGMFGLEGISLSRPGRTTTEQRLAAVLQGSNVPQPIAGGIDRVPIVDRSGGKVHFYSGDGLSQLLGDLDSWLGGVDAGMGGVGGFGFGADGPVFSAFKSRLGALSAETSASGAYCTAFGRATGIMIDYQGGVLGALAGAGAGALAGGFVGGEPGALVGGVLGGAAGGAAGALLTAYVGRVLDVDGLATQACNAVVAALADDDPDTSTTDVEMPNPVTDETGLTPTDIQIAIGLARLNAAKRVARDPVNILIGGQPVIVSSLEARQAVLINPVPDPTVVTEQRPIILGPRPGGPLAGRSAGLLRASGPAVHVGATAEGVSLRFRRVKTGEYVGEPGHRPP